MNDAHQAVPGRRAVVLSLLLAARAALVLLVAPLYGTEEVRTAARAGARSVARAPIRGHATLIAVNGPSSLVPLVVPVLVSALPVVFRRGWVRVISALLLLAFVVLGAMSVGPFYLPSAAAMCVAAALGLGEWFGRGLPKLPR